jgi:hypothetical protein
MTQHQPIELQVGDTLQLEFVTEERSPRYSVRLIGYLPKGSVLVTMPERNGRVVAVREGQNVVARGFSGSHASAFPARIIRTALHPYPYMHLSYPEEKAEVLVRSARRASVALEATVSGLRPNEGWSTWQPATLTDLSLSGLSIETALALPRGAPIKVHARLQLDNVGARVLPLGGTVRTIQESANPQAPWRLGVEFDALEPDATLMLRAFMYQQLMSR